MKGPNVEWWSMGWRACMVVAIAALAFACDDNTTKVTQDTSDVHETLQEVAEIDETVIATSYLRVIRPEDNEPLAITHNSYADLIVGFFTSENQPIAATMLDFEIVESTDNCHTASPPCVRLRAFSDETNANGQVSMSVTTAGKDADATIRVSVQGQPTVTPVQAIVQTRAKDSYDLKVSFAYNGGRSFSNVQALLYNKAVYGDCAGIFTPPLRESSALATATGQRVAARQPGTGKIDDVFFTSLGNNDTFIVVAYAETQIGSASRVTVYGCTDDGVGTEILVNLDEVPMNIKGNYALTSNFNLLSGLPKRPQGSTEPMKAGDWVEVVIGIFENPSAALVDLIWPLIVNQFGFDLPEGLKPVVVNLIDDALKNFAPQWVSNAVTIGGDIGEFARNMQLVGELEILNEADFATGHLGAGHKHSYNGISLRWRLPCVLEGKTPTECNGSRIGKTFGELGKPQLAINGTFSGAVVSCGTVQNCLLIEQHGMTLPYGEILLAVIEGYALPELFNDSRVDSLDALVELVLLDYIKEWYNEGKPPAEQVTTEGCPAVGTILARWASGFLGSGFESIIAGVGEFACNEARNYVITLIRTQAANLTVNTQDNLLLATEGNCLLKDTDNNLEYDRIGEDNARCNWDIKFIWQNNAPVDLDGLFHARRGGN